VSVYVYFISKATKSTLKTFILLYLHLTYLVTYILIYIDRSAINPTDTRRAQIKQHGSSPKICTSCKMSIWSLQDRRNVYSLWRGLEFIKYKEKNLCLFYLRLMNWGFGLVFIHNLTWKRKVFQTFVKIFDKRLNLCRVPTEVMYEKRSDTGNAEMHPFLQRKYCLRSYCPSIPRSYATKTSRIYLCVRCSICFVRKRFSFFRS
jgi:hypothetical protein